MFEGRIMSVWAMAGIYLQTLSAIAMTFFMGGVMCWWFIAAIRKHSAAHGCTVLMIYFAGLMAPFAVVFGIMLAIKELTS